ncbi:hypothetical protein ACU4GD_14435 [Cupriavidus basilensis]
MNPMNPFNGGVEPVALPGDSRLVVFPYSADQDLPRAHRPR